MRRFIASLTMFAAGALVALATSPATADMIELDFSGLNLTFASGQIYDSSNVAGGSGNYNEATLLGSVIYYRDSNYVGSSTETGTSVYADVLVNNVGPIPANDSVDSFGGSFVSLLTNSGTLLALPIDSMNISYTKSLITENVMLSGVVSGAITQNLPYGLHISPGDEVDILLTGDSLQSKSFDGQGRLTGFTSSGLGQIYTVPADVPEPSSLAALLSLAASAGVAFAWRQCRGDAR
jgi:hypothetical protein